MHFDVFDNAAPAFDGKALCRRVTTEFTVDRETTKAKFRLKDMEYRGKSEQ